MLLHQVIEGAFRAHAVLANQPCEADQGRALHCRHTVHEDRAVLLQLGQVSESCFQFIQGGQSSGAVVRQHIATGVESFAEAGRWCGFVGGAEAEHTFDAGFSQAIEVAFSSRGWTNGELIDQNPVDAEITGALHQLSNHFISR